MDIKTANDIHQYILHHDLLNQVEERTKQNWYGAGSRPTYYNALKKIRNGEACGLVESLMWLEAKALMEEHRKELAQVEVAES